ncbi:MAG: hypothetical protein U0835_14790 [Isosphaeraceae bacterium]
MKKPRVADAFARAVIERDFAQAYDLTTLGLRARTDLSSFARALVEAEAEVAPAGRYRLDGTAISFQELAESARLAGNPLPEDLHGDNFVCWLCISFLPGPDDESGSTPATTSGAWSSRRTARSGSPPDPAPE